MDADAPGAGVPVPLIGVDMGLYGVGVTAVSWVASAGAVPVSSPAGVKPRRVPFHCLSTHLMRARTAKVGPEAPDPGANDLDPMGTTKMSGGFQIACIGMGMAIDIHRTE